MVAADDLRAARVWWLARARPSTDVAGGGGGPGIPAAVCGSTAPDGAGLNGGVMNEPMMTVSGNLVSDVDMRQTARGDALARFRVASTVKRYDRATGQWVDGDTAYWNVTAWRRAAENAAQSLAKGHPVIVHGRVRQRSVDREVAGAPGITMPVTYTDLEAVSFGLDLTRCRSAYQRAPIGPQTSSAQGPTSEAATEGEPNRPIGEGGAGDPQSDEGRSDAA